VPAQRIERHPLTGALTDERTAGTRYTDTGAGVALALRAGRAAAYRPGKENAMPMTMTLDRQRPLVRITATDSYGLADVVQMITQLPPAIDMLWDVRDATTLQGAHIQQVVQHMKQQRSTSRRLALVTNSSVIFGLTRMGETYPELAGVPVTVDIFPTIEEALVWLERRLMTEENRLYADSVGGRLQYIGCWCNMEQRPRFQEHRDVQSAYSDRRRPPARPRLSGAYPHRDLFHCDPDGRRERRGGTVGAARPGRRTSSYVADACDKVEKRAELKRFC
jgi:hypothetical protein